MLFNLRGGGSGGVACAYVTYPAGTTLTCTNGSLTITDTNSSSTNRKGVCIRIPTVGTWTFSCTSGNYSDTKTIGVANGGSYQVDLYFREYMMRNGVAQSTVYYNDSEHIYINTDYQGNPMTPPENTIVYCTLGWGNHHAMVMFRLDVTNYVRLVYDNGTGSDQVINPDSYPASGLLTTSTWHQEFATMPEANYPPDTTPMSNDRAFRLFDRWRTIGGGRGTLTSRYYELDVSDLTGTKYITIGWTAFDGLRMNLTVKDVYAER